jgi:putative membrane protein
VSASGPSGPAERPDPESDPESDPEETEPDPRFSFANERTFLAWIRTALGLITAGLLVTQLLPEFEVPVGRRLIGLPLIALGVLIAARSFTTWQRNERAMRRGEALPRSSLPLLVGVVVSVVAVLAFVLVLIEGLE